MRNQQPEPIHSDVLFESSDANASRLMWIGASLLASVALIVSLTYFYFEFLANRVARLSPPVLPMNLHGDVRPPEPRIQASPSDDLRELRIREDAVLQKYGWVNKGEGRVAIPVDRAMQLLVQRGLAPQKAPADLHLFDPRAGTRQTGFEGKVMPEPR